MIDAHGICTAYSHVTVALSPDSSKYGQKIHTSKDSSENVRNQ